eukprot:6181791-Pleurochrysis_carterae.AAC.2
MSTRFSGDDFVPRDRPRSAAHADDGAALARRRHLRRRVGRRRAAIAGGTLRARTRRRARTRTRTPVRSPSLHAHTRTDAQPAARPPKQAHARASSLTYAYAFARTRASADARLEFEGASPQMQSRNTQTCRYGCLNTRTRLHRLRARTTRRLTPYLSAPPALRHHFFSCMCFLSSKHLLHRSDAMQ